MKLDKDTWMRLATAFMDDNAYLHAVYELKMELADKFGQEKDFIGSDILFPKLAQVVVELLGYDFEYWFVECDRDYDRFNEGAVDVKDNIHSLEDIYELYAKN